ncbi:MAG: helix-turn-helix domain-containing protein [Azospirillaceae bacterium]|nr:helix-turn-helix domain-containing protein [Azospirillaceae bacterium]
MLEAMVRKGMGQAQLLTKAHILLKADVSDAGEGWSGSRIAAALDTSIPTVERTRHRLVEEGFDVVLTRKTNPASARRRIFGGYLMVGGAEEAEAKLIALTCGPLPAGRSPARSPEATENDRTSPFFGFLHQRHWPSDI